jgi:hypothetical protein
MSILSSIFAGGAEGIFKGISDLVKDFKADPTELIKLQATVAQAQMDLDAKLSQADAAVIAAVNASMQAEAKSEHWMQWSWRPTVGFTFALTIVNNYVLYGYFAKYGMTQISIPDNVWLAMLTVLGAAAYTRGQEKVAKVNGK